MILKRYISIEKDSTQALRDFVVVVFLVAWYKNTHCETWIKMTFYVTGIQFKLNKIAGDFFMG